MERKITMWLRMQGNDCKESQWTCEKKSMDTESFNKNNNKNRKYKELKMQKCNSWNKTHTHTHTHTHKNKKTTLKGINSRDQNFMWRPSPTQQPCWDAWDKTTNMLGKELHHQPVDCLKSSWAWHFPQEGQVWAPHTTGRAIVPPRKKPA